MSDSDPFSNLKQKFLSMLALLFLFSLVMNVSARLLEPALPMVVVLLVLLVIGRVALGRKRWE